jgi:hypothetical protein
MVITTMAANHRFCLSQFRTFRLLRGRSTEPADEQRTKLVPYASAFCIISLAVATM